MALYNHCEGDISVHLDGEDGDVGDLYILCMAPYIRLIK